jgi:hypothetical protein
LVTLRLLRVAPPAALLAEGRPAAGSAERQQQQLAKLLPRQQLLPVQHQPQQPQRSFQEACHFDPADSGSYPCRQHLNAAIWQDLEACHEASADAASAGGASRQPPDCGGISDAALNNPFAWVPPHEEEQGATAQGARGASSELQGAAAAAASSVSSIRPKTAQIRSRTATSLPLEHFDSPEMERVDIQQRLQDASAQGRPGLPALSRFYSPDGAFSWQPCTVLQYDRCGLVCVW